MSKSFQILDHFCLLLFPKDFENLKSVYIGFQEVGAKKMVKRSEKAKFAQKQFFFALRLFTIY